MLAPAYSDRDDTSFRTSMSEPISARTDRARPVLSRSATAFAIVNSRERSSESRRIRVMFSETTVNALWSSETMRQVIVYSQHQVELVQLCVLGECLKNRKRRRASRELNLWI